MMRIINDPKLDFSDVLLIPKRSTLGSRSEVDITRTIKMPYSDFEFTGVPIIAANMDTIGTMAMATSLYHHNVATAIHKHYEPEELINFFSSPVPNISLLFYSLGVVDKDVEKFKYVDSCIEGGITSVCIDVANGYSQKFLDFVKKFRDENPHITIMAGNVVTGDMTQDLIYHGGVDIVKVGIGPGCFAPGQQVITEHGLKNIEDIQVGEKVLTHKGRYKKITNTFTFNNKKTIMRVNDIEATTNHEFYVLHRKYKDVVTEDNIEEYAEWISAKDLTNDYFLIRHR